MLYFKYSKFLWILLALFFNNDYFIKLQQLWYTIYMDVIISNIALPIFEYQCIPRCIRDYSFYILPIVNCHNTQGLGLKLKGEKINNNVLNSWYPSNHCELWEKKPNRVDKLIKLETKPSFIPPGTTKSPWPYWFRDKLLLYKCMFPSWEASSLALKAILVQQLWQVHKERPSYLMML